MSADSVLLFGVLLLAIGAGWWLGRRSRSVAMEPSDFDSSKGYYRGLNYLLNDEPDEAIDTFIQILEVNRDTLDTYLVIGQLLRRRGETERAIRIHQNLMARFDLEPTILARVKLELAQDYLTAGVYDRAERLLRELQKEGEDIRGEALRLLQEIYQTTQEWELAIHAAEHQLTARRSLLLRRAIPTDASAPRRRAIAHYCCELAKKKIDAKSWREARGYLKRALAHDRSSVRASMLLAELEAHCGAPQRALRAYQKIPEQDPDWLPEIVQELVQRLRGTAAEEEALRFLQQCLDRHPSATLTLTVADLIGWQSGSDAAAAFLEERLVAGPNLHVLVEYLTQELATRAGDAPSGMRITRDLLRQLLTHQPRYRCRNCGYQGNELHWQCPSCKTWSENKPIYGMDGE
ncbi:MAG: lipopolysaccharide assembly protein LapB [Pseudomonadota bacterium]|nr:lipopolysaccharide assembly protein LapB [Pseudomonadota bacterium]